MQGKGKTMLASSVLENQQIKMFGKRDKTHREKTCTSKFLRVHQAIKIKNLLQLCVLIAIFIPPSPSPPNSTKLAYKVINKKNSMYKEGMLTDCSFCVQNVA